MSKTKTILHVLFPGGLLFASCWVVLYTDAWLRVESTHIDTAGLIILPIGLFLALRFDRNRVLYSLLLLLAADIADRWFVAAASFVTLHKLVAILVPLNFLLLGLMKEKGVRSLRGALQILLLPLQALLVFVWLRYWGGTGYHLLEITHLPFGSGHVTDAFLAVFIGAISVQIVRYSRYSNPVEIALLWAILCASIAGLLPPGTEATLLRLFAALIIIVSMLEMSHALAYRDELTSLPGRRALHETLRKLGGTFAIAMADIDHFKKLNDTYGHDIGDQVLRMVAARLGRCGGDGRAYRYGGEEFCLVFAGKRPDEVVEPLDRLRRSIAEEPFIIRQRLRPVKKPQKPRGKSRTRRSVRVTVSIGVAGKNDHLKTPEEVLKEADRALYRAKKGGRNRVCK